MATNTASLARNITWRSSKQTYFTIALMVDRDLVDDAYRAYGYFRWLDDTVDTNIVSSMGQEKFVARQQSLIRRGYNRQDLPDLLPEEQILIDLIQNDRGTNSLLKSYILGMMDLMAFDMQRKGGQIREEELLGYSSLLASSVMDALQYFIGNRCAYPMTPDRNHAVIAAHVTHMLRDTYEDLQMGYTNISQEVLEDLGIGSRRVEIDDLDHPLFRSWVQRRVQLARLYFQEGKIYINCLGNLRCRVVGHWYCARFKSVLDAIESDGYRLRPNYDNSKDPFQWLKVAWLAALIPLLHLYDGVRLGRHPQNP